MRAFGSDIINKVNLYPSDNFLQSVEKINNSFKTISTIDLKLDSLTGTDYQNIKEKTQNAIMTIKETQKQYKDLTDGSMVIFGAGNRVLQHIHSSMNSNPAQFNAEAQDFIKVLLDLVRSIEYFDFSEYQVFYINSLRTLKKIQSIHPSNEVSIDPQLNLNIWNDPLLLRTHLDYDFPQNQIVSGEDFFEFLTDSLLGMPEERQRVYKYQNKISHYFLNNQDVIIIPNRKDDILQIKIGDDKQFPISQLGDGLQQVIILTYRAFLTTAPSFFFIEEPEMHLHAGYVKQLMKFLLNETDHYYMATSHSNYLLDMINEDKRIALYRVDKERIDNEDKYETVIKRCDGDRTILQTLGISPSSVFLANCTIWVEGITDRLYFVQYLKKYLEELKITDEEKWKDYSRFIDGYHYAFVEYQGSNLDHWDFSTESAESVDSSQNKGLSAVLVTSNALVVADSDLQGKPRFDELKEQLGDNMIITLGKETENTLPKNLLIKRFYQKCPQNAISIRGNTTKIIYKDEHLNYFDDDYFESDKGVGLYLDNTIEKMREDGIFPNLEDDQSSFTFSDKGEQGTVKGKTDFCHAIVELMQTEEWELTDSAIELCEAIFQHIKDNND